MTDTAPAALAAGPVTGKILTEAIILAANLLGPALRKPTYTPNAVDVTAGWLLGMTSTPCI